MLLKTKKEIEVWLNKYEIQNYELIKDEKYGYIVNVYNSVNLSNKNLKNIEIKFNKVYGCFDCSNNQLKSLEGCPELIEDRIFVNEDFNISYIVHGYIYCNDNELLIEGLKYLPKKIKNNSININSNKELGELQKINDFNELKEKVEKVFKIIKEKENLLNSINKKKLNNKSKTLNKI